MRFVRNHSAVEAVCLDGVEDLQSWTGWPEWTPEWVRRTCLSISEHKGRPSWIVRSDDGAYSVWSSDAFTREFTPA